MRIIGRKILNRFKNHDIYFDLLIYIAFAFSIITFIPYEVYFSNIEEFQFAPLKLYMPWVLGGVCVFGFCCINFVCNDMINKIIVKLLVGITLASYIQSMFLNGTMKQLDGIQDVWGAANRSIGLI